MTTSDNAAGERLATPAQIDLILRICKARGSYPPNALFSNKLTIKDAGLWIDRHMLPDKDTHVYK